MTLILLLLSILGADISCTVAAEIEHFDFPKQGHLTPEMTQSYEKNGFLIFADFLSEQGCNALVKEGKKLISEYTPTPETIEIFAADSASNATIKGDYFEKSSDKISFFFEDKAFESGRQIIEIPHAINKIGHALADLNPLFHAVTFRDDLRFIAEQLGVSNPLLNQSMLICKSPKIGGEVRPHQDSTFIYSAPNTTLGFWAPLEDATLDNGCLHAIPGSHTGPLLARYVKREDNFCFLDPQNDRLLETEDLINIASKWPADQFIPLPMPAGSLIVFPGHLVHKSAANLSDTSRNAYTFHVTSADSEYPKDNWLQREKFHPLKK